jgi:hypothetical protein
MIIVIKKGIGLHLTLASVRFDQFGAQRDVSIIECDTWEQGFQSAKNIGVSHALFINAGTVFNDLDEFLQQLKKYPHRGLIGHIVDPLDNTQAFYLHDQCFYLDIEFFSKEDFAIKDFTGPIPVRSEQNIHHNYTPLWLDTGNQVNLYPGKQFGERLISKQLLARRQVVNWKHTLRQFKYFLYSPEEYAEHLLKQQSYLDVAENQLWIFNNESFNIFTQNTRLVCPASGLYWMFNLVNTSLTNIDLVDISDTQIQFAQELWNKWDGNDYGQFVADFVKTNKIQHISLDQINLDEIEKLKLKQSSYLRNTVNNTFDALCNMYNIKDFRQLWINRHRVKVTFTKTSIVDFVNTYEHAKYDLWISNILDYKYTLIKHTREQIEQFNQVLEQHRVNLR